MSRADELRELIDEATYWDSVELPTDYSHAAVNEREKTFRRRSDARYGLTVAAVNALPDLLAVLDAAERHLFAIRSPRPFGVVETTSMLDSAVARFNQEEEKP